MVRWLGVVLFVSGVGVLAALRFVSKPEQRRVLSIAGVFDLVVGAVAVSLSFLMQTP